MFQTNNSYLLDILCLIDKHPQQNTYRASIRQKTFCMRFQNEMSKLNKIIQQCDIHFIRWYFQQSIFLFFLKFSVLFCSFAFFCEFSTFQIYFYFTLCCVISISINPNNEQQPNIFNSHIVLRQINLSGIFDAIRIRKLGFGFKLDFNTFITRYSSLTSYFRQSGNLRNDTIELVKRLARQFRFNKDEFIVGKTKIFIKNSEITITQLEHHRNDKMKEKKPKVKRPKKQIENIPTNVIISGNIFDKSNELK